MNKEVIKAMNKKETKLEALSNWWDRNGYKIMRVIFFPVWWGIKAKEKINKELNSRVHWDEKRADDILSYYIPRKCEWNSGDKTFYLYDNGYGWGIKKAKKFLKRKDYRFWEINSMWWGGEIKLYLIKKFELEGFNKEVLDYHDGTVEIIFKLIEKEG